MKRVAILGATGLLGTELLGVLREAGHTVLAPTRHELDVTDYAALESFFTTHKPDIVINATALINVDALEEDPYLGWQVNALAAGAVARALCRAAPHARLIHISTNYVFGDEKNTYHEDDAVAPINVYGQTKAVGESLVAHYGSQANLAYNIVRTSWLYGPAKDTFVDYVAKTLLKGDAVHASVEQWGNCTSARDMAETLLAVFIQQEQPSGIYHCCNDVQNERHATSRYDIALCIAVALGVPAKLVKEDSEERYFKAKRPAHAVLINTKLPSLAPWEQSLRAYITSTYGGRGSAVV